MEEIDAYRTANILIKQYQGEAHSIALKRRLSMMSQSDFNGADAWQRIAEAVIWLQSNKAPTTKDKAH